MRLHSWVRTRPFYKLNPLWKAIATWLQTLLHCRDVMHPSAGESVDSFQTGEKSQDSGVPVFSGSYCRRDNRTKHIFPGVCVNLPSTFTPPIPIRQSTSNSSVLRIKIVKWKNYLSSVLKPKAWLSTLTLHTCGCVFYSDLPVGNG